MKRKVWRTMELREAYERYLAGDDYEEIAKAAGCTAVAVQSALASRGYITVEAHEARMAAKEARGLYPRGRRPYKRATT